MLGGVITFFLLKGAGLPYLLAALLAVILVVLIGVLLQVLVVYPLRKASVLILLMATLGASIFLSNTSGLIFGTLPKALPPFSGDQPWLNLVPLFFREVDLLRHPGANVGYHALVTGRSRRDAQGTCHDLADVLVVGRDRRGGGRADARLRRERSRG